MQNQHVSSGSKQRGAAKKPNQAAKVGKVTSRTRIRETTEASEIALTSDLQNSDDQVSGKSDKRGGRRTSGTSKRRSTNHKRDPLSDTLTDAELGLTDTNSHIHITSSDEPGSVTKADDDKDRDSDYESISSCDTLLELIKTHYAAQKDEILKLKRKIRNDMKSVRKNKRKGTNPKRTGFTTDEIIPEKLTKLLGIPKGTTMPRTKLTQKVYKLLKDRGLQYKGDGRVLRTDKEIRAIFNLSETVDKSIDPKDKEGFNFFTMQTHIARLYNESANPEAAFADPDPVIAAATDEEEGEPQVKPSISNSKRKSHGKKQQKQHTIVAH